jgi:hypothetical protein
MTPLSQILALVEQYTNISHEYEQLASRLTSGDGPVDVDVLFTEGPYRTQLTLSVIVAEVDNVRKQVVNALAAVGIDPTA